MADVINLAEENDFEELYLSYMVFLSECTDKNSCIEKKN